ncbi:MAG TPA: ATP synthase F1 subunit delta [Longimicrobiales bacterium]|nr:ATP synthase F1 subunit delta [Longimicrobiales bacterium]
MASSTITRTYAEALYEVAERDGQAQAFAEAFDEVAGLLRTQPRVRTFVEAPTVDPEEKKRVLREALSGRVPAHFLNFLLVVLDKRRQRLLLQMAREYHAILDERMGRVHADVTLAREPDERFEEEIASGLSERLGRTVVPHIQVDPRILGGIVVRYEDRVLDASLRRRLLGLRRRMMAVEVGGGI